jgi:hypothetical protein
MSAIVTDYVELSQAYEKALCLVEKTPVFQKYNDAKALLKNTYSYDPDSTPLAFSRSVFKMCFQSPETAAKAIKLMTSWSHKTPETIGIDQAMPEAFEDAYIESLNDASMRSYRSAKKAFKAAMMELYQQGKTPHDLALKFSERSREKAFYWFEKHLH